MLCALDFFSRSCMPWPPQADMRGRGLSTPEKHIAPGHKMRKRVIGEYADR
jgi:hypothetical protein